MQRAGGPPPHPTPPLPRISGQMASCTGFTRDPARAQRSVSLGRPVTFSCLCFGICSQGKALWVPVQGPVKSSRVEGAGETRVGRDQGLRQLPVFAWPGVTLHVQGGVLLGTRISLIYTSQQDGCTHESRKHIVLFWRTHQCPPPHLRAPFNFLP